jgi:hypothetical protein
VIFLVGCVLYADDRLVAAVRRDLVPALVIGIVSLAGLIGFGFETWSETRESIARRRSTLSSV